MGRHHSGLIPSVLTERAGLRKLVSEQPRRPRLDFGRWRGSSSLLDRAGMERTRGRAEGSKAIRNHGTLGNRRDRNNGAPRNTAPGSSIEYTRPTRARSQRRFSTELFLFCDVASNLLSVTQEAISVRTLGGTKLSPALAQSRAYICSRT